jgi:phosphomevalonate kinase
MNKIIIISGKQYSGKDTLAKILLEELKDFKRVGIADAIKIQYGKQNNLSFEEIEKNKYLYRNDLINLGNWGRSISPFYWLEQLSDMSNIIIPDIRVYDELEYFRNRGAYTIRVNSSYLNRSKRGVITNENDKTETALDDYTDWDYVIENNSDFESFKIKSKDLLEKVKSYIKQD